METQGGGSDGESVQYLSHSVKVIRGRERKAIEELESEGWELVSQTRGTVRTELTFRKPKPPGLSTKLKLAIGAVVVCGLAAMGIGGAISDRASNDEEQAIATKSVSPTTSPRSSSSTTSASASPTVSTPMPTATSPTTVPSASPTVAPSRPAPPVKIVNTTVDALLDKLNANGGRAGAMYRVTAELMHPEMWFVGRTGDYVVMLSAKGGVDDLSVFVDEGVAADWSDGTKVQLVLKDVNRTLDGETTDGWLEVVSAKTL